jgi:hypothetical protein
MTTREKIIVGMAVLALGYGGIELFLPRAKNAPVPPPSQALEGLNTFIAKIADATKTGSAEANAHVMRKAESPWRQNPFLKMAKAAPEPRPPAPDSGVKPPERPKPSLKYTGFIDMGERRLAIINGLEYETGDQVEPGDFRIKSILPNKVVLIYSRGAAAPIELPLQDSE